MTDAPLLHVQNLTRRYGGVVAVDDVGFDVARASITALIGPNGAGKTTTLNLISGITQQTSGRVQLLGEDTTGLRPDELCHRGLARTFQTPQIFASMTVQQNVSVGTTRLGHISLIRSALRLPSSSRAESAFLDEAQQWLHWVGIDDLASTPMSALSFGQIRMVEIARMLASKPKVVLMDEPASGLSRVEAQALQSLIFRIRELGITILLVEHNMPLVMTTADHIIVLDKGRLLAQGDPRSIQENRHVRDAYLGHGA